MVFHLLVHLGWVDLSFDCSTVCLILLWLMGIWQNQLGNWARTSKSKSTQPDGYTSRWDTM